MKTPFEVIAVESYPRDPLARLGLTDFYMKTG
jgi:hypothetical protein